MLAPKLAKHSRLFLEGEFLRDHIVATNSLPWPDDEIQLENISRSPWTVTRCLEVIDEDLSDELLKRAADFALFFPVLYQSTEIKDAAQLLILIPGISGQCEILEEFLALESMSRTSRGCDLKSVPERLESFTQPRTLSVTTDGSLYLTRINARLSWRIKNRVKDDGTCSGLIFLHCIFHPV